MHPPSAPRPTNLSLPVTTPLPMLGKAGRYRLFGLGICLPLLLLLLILLPLLQHQSFAFDQHWMVGLHQYARPLWDDLAIGLAYLGGLPVSMCIWGLLGIGVSRAGTVRRQQLCFLGVVFVGAVILSWSIKFWCHRPRPELWPRLVQDYGASFPSGHSLYAMVLAYVGLLLGWQTRWRRILAGVAALWVVAMGLSRVYLGVHYPTDVLGGWLLGLVWVSLVYALWRVDPQGSSADHVQR